jgi:hypothetical protein
MSQAHAGRRIRCERGVIATGAVDALSFMAAPTFAIMALLTGAHHVGPPDAVCSAPHQAPLLDGMVVMYALMSAFHSGPWLKLICGRQKRPPAG